MRSSLYTKIPATDFSMRPRYFSSDASHPVPESPDEKGYEEKEARAREIVRDTRRFEPGEVEEDDDGGERESDPDPPPPPPHAGEHDGDIEEVGVEDVGVQLQVEEGGEARRSCDEEEDDEGFYPSFVQDLSASLHK
jgi:hypothetical protein